MKIPKSVTVFSWSLYDFANTIFAMNITSLYFPLWVTIDKNGQDLLYSLAFSLSMLFVSITLPIMGIISDRYKRRIPFLIFFTLVCVLFTGLMGVVNRLLAGLALFAIANFCYQIAGSVFYNPILPEITTKDKIGRVSGYGISLGYVGTIVGLLMVKPFVLRAGHQAAFIPSAILFLLFSLPCFLFVKDKNPSSFKGFKLSMVKEAWGNLKETLLRSRTHPDLIRFIIAIFIAVNAINTIIIFMAVYARKVIGFCDSELTAFFICSTAFAIIGSLLFGLICDLFGPKKVLSFVLCMWIGTVLLATASTTKSVFWIVGPLAGCSLGGTWTSARHFVVELSPPAKIGEFFGLAGLAGKSAAIAGPLIWGLIVWGFGFLGLAKYRIATFVLAVLIFTGLIILQKVEVTRK